MGKSLATIVQDQDQGSSTLEKKLTLWQEGISSDLAKELSNIDDKLDKAKGLSKEDARNIRELQDKQQEIAQELEKFRRDVLTAPNSRDLDEHMRELYDTVKQMESRIGIDFETRHNRFIEDTRHLKSEAAAIAALDEQLWLTDQRLGQRVDELQHAHAESIAVF